LGLLLSKSALLVQGILPGFATLLPESPEDHHLGVYHSATSGGSQHRHTRRGDFQSPRAECNSALRACCNRSQAAGDWLIFRPVWFSRGVHAPRPKNVPVPLPPRGTVPFSRRKAPCPEAGRSAPRKSGQSPSPRRNFRAQALCFPWGTLLPGKSSSRRIVSSKIPEPT